jgi:hypothetical protein
MKTLYLKKSLYMFLGILFSAGIILANVAVYGIAVLIFKATGSPFIEWLVSNEDYNVFDTFKSALLIVILTFVYMKLHRNQEKPEVKWSVKKGLAYGFLAGIGFAGVSFVWLFFVKNALSGIEFMRRSLEGMNSSFEEYSRGSAVFLILAAGILGPIVEELLFRGIVFDMFERVKKGWFPVVFSAVFFGLAHLQPVQSVYTTIMGLIAGTIYLKTRNLWWPIVMHITINMFATLSSFKFMENHIGTWKIFTVVMIIPMVYIMYELTVKKYKVSKEELPCEV